MEEKPTFSPFNTHQCFRSVCLTFLTSTQTADDKVYKNVQMKNVCSNIGQEILLGFIVAFSLSLNFTIVVQHK